MVVSDLVIVSPIIPVLTIPTDLSMGIIFTFMPYTKSNNLIHTAHNETE